MAAQTEQTAGISAYWDSVQRLQNAYEDWLRASGKEVGVRELFWWMNL
jgi:hypothetical protein